MLTTNIYFKKWLSYEVVTECDIIFAKIYVFILEKVKTVNICSIYLKKYLFSKYLYFISFKKSFLHILTTLLVEIVDERCIDK